MQKQICLFILLAVANMTIAQTTKRTVPYRQALGVRANVLGTKAYDFLSGSYKLFFSPRSAIELNAGISYEEYVLRNEQENFEGVQVYQPFFGALSYQLHIPMKGGLSFIIGAEGHVRFLKDDLPNYPGTAPPPNDPYTKTFENAKTQASLGLGPVGGFDFKSPKAPVNITLDHRPAFLNVNRQFDGEVELLNIALAVRYTFGPRR
ncbi:hypothetical protein [Niabella drilacis]|uniref:Outer membrane protein beta-barrel domain-containing protein n=1 Tax=Niabella drilacis (strain DSM 25811 / CCM 8410 / CCUG 62505 / LMG 26954 / E90) TaxID=1285928 RepID=A0A1G6N6L3_NIADE|nr:hypothetical protein [Niabella drilacis]SDC63490.1 hypothetical protein SAMN04487894_103174 [Niabella drilacis]